MIAPRAAAEMLAGSAGIFAFVDPAFAAAFAVAAAWIEWLEYVAERDEKEEP